MRTYKTFFRATFGIVVLLLLVNLDSFSQKTKEVNWKLGTQAYTFKEYSFFEAIDKAHSLGLKWIEGYPGQKLSLDQPEAKMGPGLTAEQRKAVKDKLGKAGITLVNFGVVGFKNNEEEARKMYEFGKDMGIQTFTAEPEETAFDMLEKLCQEYKIKLAIHNHPEPSRYWNPDKVLEVINGRSDWIGACADIGHWTRSGINPVDALKKLEGKIISLHFKDLNEFGVKSAHDVVWGTGKSRIEEVLKELNRQKFKGVFSIEYEHNWTTSVPEIKECIAHFDKVAKQLGQPLER